MKCDFPDDTVWSSRAGAERAIGLAHNTISTWVSKGLLVRPTIAYRPTRPNKATPLRYPDAIRMGDIRELVEAHRCMPRKENPEPEPVRMTLRDRLKQKRAEAEEV